MISPFSLGMGEAHTSKYLPRWPFPELLGDRLPAGNGPLVRTMGRRLSRAMHDLVTLLTHEVVRAPSHDPREGGIRPHDPEFDVVDRDHVGRMIENGPPFPKLPGLSAGFPALLHPAPRSSV